ncbi:MAG TPA: hypothetical protein PLP42_05015 [Acidobacteriota bacterium]|nr:hypothetical protein [Acidobacteriota bacterium]
MGQRSDEIKRHIDNQRNELSENLEELEERVKKTTNWRAQVEKRPLTALGIAFGSGLLLGSILPIGGGRSEYHPQTAGPHAQPLTGQGYSGSSGGAGYVEPSRRTAKKTATSRELRRAWTTLDTIRASLVGFGAAKLKEYLGQMIPGFEEHYRRTEEEQRKAESTETTTSTSTDPGSSHLSSSYSSPSTTPEI